MCWSINSTKNSGNIGALKCPAPWLCDLVVFRGLNFKCRCIKFSKTLIDHIIPIFLVRLNSAIFKTLFQNFIISVSFLINGGQRYNRFSCVQRGAANIFYMFKRGAITKHLNLQIPKVQYHGLLKADLILGVFCQTADNIHTPESSTVPNFIYVIILVVVLTDTRTFFIQFHIMISWHTQIIKIWHLSKRRYITRITMIFMQRYSIFWGSNLDIFFLNIFIYQHKSGIEFWKYYPLEN